MNKTASSAESAIIGIAALNPITAAIATLYSVTSNINDFINTHIEKLKGSENNVIACTGRVLEAAKFGFGLGYLSSVALMAVGQLLLGNNLIVGVISAAGTLTSAALISNPIAMTCGAIGAICYGWGALTDQEKAAILNRVQTGLEIGVELIKSLIDFVTRKMKELLDSKQWEELKEFVRGQAAQFGKTLYDITGRVTDLVKGAAEKIGDITGNVIEKFNDVADQAKNSTLIATKKALDVTNQAAEDISDATVEIIQNIKNKMKNSNGS